MAFARWLKNGIDGVMRALSYEPVTTTFALEHKHIEERDHDRIIKETLFLTVRDYEASIGDIKEVREQVAAIPPDAPPIMLRHLIEQQDHLLEQLTTKAERRVRAREQAKLRERDPETGRFLPAPREIT
jgi:hypothetical protein